MVIGGCGLIENISKGFMTNRVDGLKMFYKTKPFIEKKIKHNNTYLSSITIIIYMNKILFF